MSSVHDKSDALQTFQAGIKATVKELLGELDEQGRRWTTTSIAKAGRLSRNQLYAWMGQGPQRLKGLPPRDRVIEFYLGVQKSCRHLFRDIGWHLPVDEDAEAPRQAQMPPESELDRMIRLIETRLGQGPPVDERRELELKLVRARRARDAKRLADELMAEIDDEDLRHQA